MKVVEIFAKDVKPLKLAHVSDLADVVVIAGPNGVGKTRLITKLLQHVRSPGVDANFYITIAATNDGEKEDWGKDRVTTSDGTDIELLRKTIQKNRKRSNFTSSFLNFESNRTIQKVDPYNWDWNFGDPFLEELGWAFGMSNMTTRFQDVVHSIFRKIRSQRESVALRYEELVKAQQAAAAGKSADEAKALMARSININPAEFPDPLLQFKTAFSQLLAPKQLIDPEIKNQQLSYKTESGEVLQLSELSSGEREVVNIVFDFLLRGPNDCIVVFDEPELHLHPELSYRLLQTLRRTGLRNQFIFCTHSAEIITASLENTVIFIAPPKTPDFNQALVVKEDDETHQALSHLGQSIGIISLGKKIVLIEGEGGSLDKQTYGAILKDRFPRLVLVPSGGKAVLQSFADLNEKVLSKAIWGVEFFMLCDRDAVPVDDQREVEKATAGRLRMLSRYHLENYFLDENTIARFFSTMTPDGDWRRSPQEVRKRLLQIARKHASYAAALTAAAFVREMVGNVDVMPKGCNGRTTGELSALISDRSKSESARVLGALDKVALEKRVTVIMDEIEKSLDRDSDGWKALIPGKLIVREFCSTAGIDYDYLRTGYINLADKMDKNPFAEIIEIFSSFDAKAVAA